MASPESKLTYLDIHDLKWAGSNAVGITGSVPIAINSVTMLLGPSGAGKSTILKGAAGWHQKLQGVCKFKCHSSPKAGTAIVYLPQQPSDIHNERYSVRKHLEVASRLFDRYEGIDQQTHKISCIINKLHLEEAAEKRPEELSGGMRQRLALGMALLRRPTMLFLDEPFSNQDSKKRKDLQNLLQEFVSSDQSYAITMMATHSLDDTISLGSSILLIDDETKNTGKLKSYVKKSACTLQDESGIDNLIDDEDWHDTVIDIFKNL